MRPVRLTSLCYWTRRALTHGERCYKGEFYGVPSHMCMQMTVNPRTCNLDCMFCWRSPLKQDDPEIPRSAEDMLKAARRQHRALVCGYHTNPSALREIVAEALHPRMCTISLSGEPTLSPVLPQVVEQMKKCNLVVFLVTNGTRMSIMTKMHPLPDQVYFSLSAGDSDGFQRLCRPTRGCDWDDVLAGLDILRALKTRRVIRITFLKGLTEQWADSFSRLVLRGLPDYVEIKAYEHRGSSTGTLSAACVPAHDDIRSLAERIGAKTGFRLSAFNRRSRVSLLSRDVRAEKARMLFMPDLHGAGSKPTSGWGPEPVATCSESRPHSLSKTQARCAV